MSKRFVAVVTDDRFGHLKEERAVLEPLGVELRTENCISSSDIAAKAKDADALLVNMAPLERNAILSLKKCRVVSRYGVGLDNIDAAACLEAGIKLYNVPGYCDREVAEHALSLLLALSRGIPERDRLIKSGMWNIASAQLSVAGSVIGIAGFGPTAKAFAEMAMALRPAKLLVWSPSLEQKRLKEALALPAGIFGVDLAAVSFDELLAGADFLSVHLKLVPESLGLFGQSAFAKIKKGAILVNTARGALVDSVALAAALKEGKLAGAGLDVLDAEPPLPGHPLLSAPNVILTDHSAYRSERSLSELKRRAAENVARGLGL
ncbi:C-terminal binding protein [Spirochaetota bacterium]